MGTSSKSITTAPVNSTSAKQIDYIPREAIKRLATMCIKSSHLAFAHGKLTNKIA